MSASFEQKVAQLRELVLRPICEIKHWLMAPCPPAEYPTDPNRYTECMPFCAPGIWGKYDQTVYFHSHVKIPGFHPERKLYIQFDIDEEGLVYIDERPYAGLDPFHTCIPLPGTLSENETVKITLEAHHGRHRSPAAFRKATLIEAHPSWLHLLNGVSLLWESIMVMDPPPRLRSRATQVMDRLIECVKEEKSCEQVEEELAGIISETLAPLFPGKFFAIPQSHIDLVWLWPLRETIRKAARTLSTVCTVHKEFPEFRFTLTQPALLWLMKSVYPQLYERIRDLIRSGGIEIAGGMWVEPDCNIPSGESLIRQFLYGKKFIEEEFGVTTEVLYLPDTFGYSFALPQIMRGCETHNFVTTKLTWNDTTTFPLATFCWQGMDGSVVDVHVTPVMLGVTAHPKYLPEIKEKAASKQAIPLYPLLIGHGDGGGGPEFRDASWIQWLQDSLGENQYQISSFRTFFDHVKQHRDELPMWDRELYLELHRGTLTSFGYLKKENRRLEFMLRDTEILCACTGTFDATVQNNLLHAWRLLLLHQFHDILPGTAIQEAYDDTYRDYEMIDSVLGRTLEEQIEPKIVQKDNESGITVFNTLSWTRNCIAEIAVPSEHVLPLDENNNVLPHQMSSLKPGTMVVYLDSIPPLSARMIVLKNRPGTSPQPSPEYHIGENFFENDYLRLTLNDEGEIISLIDKSTGEEFVEPQRSMNEFQTFREQPTQWEAWDLDPDYENKRIRIFRTETVSVLERGPVRGVIRVVKQSPAGSSIVQDIIVYPRSRRVDFRTTILYQEKQVLLKCAFPTSVRSDTATFEIQFGHIERSTQRRTPQEKAQYEVCGHKWVDVSMDGKGIALLNDGKYGFDVKGGVLRMSLLRSPCFPHPVYPHVLTSDAYHDQGLHSFTYSVVPHGGNWRDANIVHQAYELNVPCRVFHGKCKEPYRVPFIEVSTKSIIIETIKWAEDGEGVYIVRLYEAYGLAAECQLTTSFVVRKAYECNMLERNDRAIDVHERRNISLSFRKHEIKTLKLYTAE